MKIVIIFFKYISLNLRFDAQNSHPIETALLSTHNICFGREIRKLDFIYPHGFLFLHFLVEFQNQITQTRKTCANKIVPDQ